MDDGVGAALGIFIGWYGILGLAVVIRTAIDYTKEKLSPKDERSTQQKYNLSWKDINSSAGTDEKQLKNIS